MRFMKTRGRALVVFLFSVPLTMLFTFTCNWAAEEITGPWGLPIGGALILLSVPFYFFAGSLKVGYPVSILLNTVGMGFCASAYYSMSGEPCGLGELLPGALIALAVLFAIAFVLTLLPQLKHPIVCVGGVLEIALIVIFVVLWVKQNADSSAFTVFSLLMAAFYTVVFGLTVDEEERSLLKDIALGSYGAFALVAAVALIAVALIAGDGCDCDGDCCDEECCDCSGCDCGSGDATAKKRTKQK